VRSIVTDRWGIPHVRAESLEDLYYAWGWVTGRDRLWQISYARQAGRGELWRWFGNTKLRDDGGAQLLEFGAMADRIWRRERGDSTVRIPIERFTDGVVRSKTVLVAPDAREVTLSARLDGQVPAV